MFKNTELFTYCYLGSKCDQKTVLEKTGIKKYVEIKNKSSCICAICGRTDMQYAVEFDRLFSDSFGEYSQFAGIQHDNKYVCPYCVFAIRDENRKLLGFITVADALKEEFKLIPIVGKEKAKQISGGLTKRQAFEKFFSLPEELQNQYLMVAFNRLGKKGTHFIHKAVVNIIQADSFYFTVNNEVFFFDRMKMKSLLDLIDEYKEKNPKTKTWSYYFVLEYLTSKEPLKGDFTNEFKILKILEI